MRWGLIRKFPKFVLVFGLLVGSTVLFTGWWITHKTREAVVANAPKAAVENAAKIARVEAEPKTLLLVDNDLYDLDSGALIFKNWLKGAMPGALFYDSKAKKLFARYDRGFARFSLDGTEEATLAQKAPPAFSDDLKWAVYAKDKDLWKADIDWVHLKFQNERRLTTIEQFNEMYFAQSIMLGTDHTLILRNMNKLLRVNLDSGEVKLTRVPLLEVGKRRSPNGKFLVGIARGQFYCYDVDLDDSKTIPLGRTGFNDYQWLGNDRCAVIAASKAVVLFDRQKMNLSEVCPLPSQCIKVGDPSPDGRYVFCVGRGNGVLVDLQKKTATAVAGGAGATWVSGNTFALSRELPDSDLRGTWLQTAGEGERRVSPEPYLVGASGALMMRAPTGLIIYATKRGISTMRPDGSQQAELIKLPSPPKRALAIADWKQG